MRKIISHIRNNMSAIDWQQYCADFVTGCVVLAIVVMFWGLFG